MQKVVGSSPSAAWKALQIWSCCAAGPVAHTIVAGDDPALIFAVGARKERGSVRYPFEPAAIHHVAGVREATVRPRSCTHASRAQPSAHRH
jgi:hypothetical protein